MDSQTVSAIVLEELRSLRTDMFNRLDKLVSTEAFAAEQRRVDERHAALARDIADESAAREKAVEKIGEAQAKSSAAMRWLWTGIIVPFAGLAVTLYLATKGS